MSNRLAGETSPYLLQHADNPVDWRPWNDDALAHARETGKPILLSIGYSACHWCHVMAHESFEDPATAALMNRLYVNVKVDREERPDLDKIYQTAHQMFTGRPGGWPLTVFLTPDRHLPIFTGTYFPKSAAYGMPAYKDVLERVAEFFRERPDDVDGNGKRLLDALEALTAGAADPTEPNADPLDAAPRNLAATFDHFHGGFGDAPKFPHATNLDLLLEDWQSASGGDADRQRSLDMATQTLDRMAAGGLYDHLGGGFFRYCVDRGWTIPHFEKMLYDNAALLGTYADAYAGTGRDDYRRVAEGTAAWVVGEMQGDHGGYYSTLDADSDGHEGAFYVWRPDELEALLERDEIEVAAAHFGLTRNANFEGKAWHLQIAEPLDALGERLALAPGRAAALLESARAKLLQERARRTRPGRDEKTLASWNGLMIAAMAKASRRLGAPELEASATRALDFVRAELWDGRRLKTAYKDGRARFDAYLDDYAFLAAGALELLQCRWRDGDLELARQWLDVVLEHFADPRGGFFFTADDHEDLIYRPKPLADEATPSGNGVAALALEQLGHILGEQRYLDAADGVVRAAFPLLDRYPEAHATILGALRRRLQAPEILVVRGDDDALAAWRARVAGAYRPALTTLFIPADRESLPGLLAERAPGDGPLAYLCRGMQCEAPISDLETLAAALG